MDKLKAIGVNSVTWDIGEGPEIEGVTRAVADYTQTGFNLRRTMGGSSSVVVGCIAMNDPELEQPCCFEEQIVEHAAMIIFWTGNDAPDENVVVRETPSPSYKVEFDSLTQKHRQ